jgi:hypothetical protein
MRLGDVGGFVDTDDTSYMRAAERWREETGGNCSVMKWLYYKQKNWWLEIQKRDLWYHDNIISCWIWFWYGEC